MNVICPVCGNCIIHSFINGCGHNKTIIIIHVFADQVDTPRRKINARLWSKFFSEYFFTCLHLSLSKYQSAYLNHKMCFEFLPHAYTVSPSISLSVKICIIIFIRFWSCPLIFKVRANVYSSSHWVGTARMGNLRNESVVDERLCVWGVENLRVAGKWYAPRSYVTLLFIVSLFALVFTNSCCKCSPYQSRSKAVVVLFEA